MAINVGDIISHLKLDKSGYTSGLKQAGDESEQFKSKSSGSFNALKVVAVAAFAAISAAVVKTMKDASDFQKQMANVSTMLSGNVTQTMGIFEDALLNMSKQFGESTDTLAKGLYDILSASIPAEQALQVLETSAIAAQAGLTSTGVAADALTTIINSYKLSAEDAAMVSDILFTTVKRGKTTFAELAPSIGRVAALAQSAGITLEEMSATLAVLTRNGLETSEAITAMRGIVTAFLKPTEEMAEMFGENAIQSEGFLNIMEDLADLDPTVLAKLFPNVRGLTGATIAAKDLGEEMKAFHQILSDGSPTMEAFAKQTETFDFTFRQFQQTLKTISIEVGEIFLKTFQGVFGNLTDVLEQNRQTFIEIGETINGVIVNFTDFIRKSIDAESVLKGISNVLAIVGDAFNFLIDVIEQLPIGMVIDLFTGLTGIVKDISGAIKEATKSYDQLNKDFKAQREHLQDLNDKYLALKGKVNLTTAEKEALKKVTEDLIALNPTLKGTIESETKSLEEQSAAIKEAILEGLVDQQKLVQAKIRGLKVDKETLETQKMYYQGEGLVAKATRQRLNDDIKLKEEYIKKEAKLNKELQNEINKIRDEIKTEDDLLREDKVKNVQRTSEKEVKIVKKREKRKSEIIIEDTLSTLQTTDAARNAFAILAEQAAEREIENNRIKWQEIVGDAKDAMGDMEMAFQDMSENVDQSFDEMVEDFKQSFNEMKSVVQMVTASIQGVVGSFFDWQSSALDNQLAEKIAAINEEEISEEKKKDKIEKLEKRFAKKKWKMEVDQFNAEKALKVTQTIIDTASAVVEALPNVVLAGIVGTLGAIQTGLILAQEPPPPPAFQHGGLIEGDAGIDNNLIRASSGEFVVNREATAKNIDLLNAINSGAQGNTGISIQGVPFQISLDGKVIADTVIQFIERESDKGRVRINPKAIQGIV